MSKIPYNTSNPNSGYNSIETQNSHAKAVLEEASGNYIVNDKTTLTSVCPHNGCRLNYNKQSEQFVCPYHNSKFNLNGKCLQGPACPNRINVIK